MKVLDPKRSARRLSACAAIALALCVSLRAADDAAAKAVTEASGVSTGLCVVLGCGKADSAGLLPALASSGTMMVHGLAFDDAALQRARTQIAAQGAAGRATAERWNGKTLPYLDGLARLIVVEDPAALAAAGIPKDELLRVLAPGGTLCTPDGGKWKAEVKPRPPEMDEWTHPHHGADENMVSADKAIAFPISLRWLDGVPTGRGGFGSCAGTRAVVLAGGRCFSVSVDDRGAGAAGGDSAVLLARDAYSGFPIWKLDCETTWNKVQLDWRNVWPLVATDKHVYSVVKDQLQIMDAATGKVLATCPTPHPAKRLVLVGETLIAACWEKLDVSNHKDGFENDGIRAVWWPGGAGSVEAFDAPSGKPKWSLPLSVLTLAAQGKTAYLLSTTGNPPTERALVAVDIASGKEKWRVAHTALGSEPDTCLNFAGPECVVVSRTKNKDDREAIVLNEADGAIRFRIPKSVARCIVGSQLWCSDGRYDLKSGQKVPGGGIGNTYAGGNVVGGCVPPIVVGERYITASRGCGYLELNADPSKPPGKLGYSGARGACIQGMVPANGMFYTAQNNCGCVGAQVGGFLGVGHSPEPPAAEAFASARPVEKGPAFGASGPPAGADDWPTYRCTIERSGGTTANLPATLKVLWKAVCAKPGEGPFADAWDTRIGVPQPLTAPVVAAGKVFVAGVNSGEVQALDPGDGKPKWKVLLGSRIDTPPTYHNGLLLLGCHDGWAYALRAEDGALAYRVRVAPEERRLPAHGMIESVWPAVGTILVYDGVGYAAAGRSTQTDGGIALLAFKPESGETVWAKALCPPHNFLANAFSVQDKELVWTWMRMDPKSGAELEPAQKYYGQNSMVDGSWTSGFGRRSGRAFALGSVCQNIMAWNEKLLVAPGLAIATEKCALPKPGKDTNKVKHPDAVKKEDIAWNTNLEPHSAWARVYAMALSGSTAFYAGAVYSWGSKFAGDFLWMKSTADGKSTQEPMKLDAAPCFDGMAIAGGRFYLALQDGTLLCLGE